MKAVPAERKAEIKAEILLNGRWYPVTTYEEKGEFLYWHIAGMSGVAGPCYWRFACP